MKLHELDAVGRAALAALLPDTPENVISNHLLKTGNCRVWSERDCVLLESEQYAPGEPHLIGSEVSSLLALLRERPEWRAANIDPRIASAMSEELAAIGIAVQLVEDRYFNRADAPDVPAAPEARLLRSADAATLARAREAFAGFDPALGAPWTIGAGSFDGDEIVSLAAVTAQTPRYANISAVTLPEWRDKGHATAAAAVLSGAIVRGKRKALWSCAESNGPSLAIAEALGFTEATTRTYLVRERSAI
jgi:RimJ/RimL family protein N-acetyltransferase